MAILQQCPWRRIYVRIMFLGKLFPKAHTALLDTNHWIIGPCSAPGIHTLESEQSGGYFPRDTPKHPILPFPKIANPPFQRVKSSSSSSSLLAYIHYQIQMTRDIPYKHTECYGYYRDHMDNTKSVYIYIYIYANWARSHGWFMSPWVQIWNNEIWQGAMIVQRSTKMYACTYSDRMIAHHHTSISCEPLWSDF